MRNHSKRQRPTCGLRSKRWLQMVLAYPDQHIETVNTLTIPKDRPVVFKLQAMDTMTSFWIPQLGGQKYAMTGMTMNWTLTADQLGTFRGRNSNFNGEDLLVKHLKFTL